MSYTLYKGDCLEEMKKIPDGSVDMILCDLPYGTTACAWDSVIPFDALWAEYCRVAKRDAAIVLTASQPFTSALVMSNVRCFKTEWIWKKNAGSNFGSVKHVPMKEHESVLVFCKGKTNYQPQMQERSESGKARVKSAVRHATTSREDFVYSYSLTEMTSIRPELRYPSSVQNFNRERGMHPTQKPVSLMEYLIRTYTNPGDVVLDNCMGSGTTGVACANTGRKFVGIEMNEKYFEIASKRISDAFDNRLI